MKGRRGAIALFVGFLLSMLIIILFWVFIKVGIAIGAKPEGLTLSITAEDLPGSVACDYVLLNFLRSEGKDGLSPAELISTSSLTDFKSYADDWFTLNYTRGNPRMRGWQIQVAKSGAPMLVTGKIDLVNSKFGCAQTVPSSDEDYHVNLWLEY